MFAQSQVIFVVQEVINFEQLKGKSEWKSQALEMLTGARWEFNPDGIFVYAPAHGRKDLFPLQGKYATEGNKVVLEGMTSLSVSASIASAWCVGEIDFADNLPTMNLQWRNNSSTAATIVNSLFDSNLSSAYRATLLLRQILEK